MEELKVDSPSKHPDYKRIFSFPKDRIKILLLEGVSQTAVDALTSEGFQVEAHQKLSKEDLEEKIAHVHAIGVRSKTKLDADLLAKAKKLLCVGCFCIGTDQTDLDAAALLGVPVFNSPYANTRSVAEMILSEIIMLSRQLGDRNNELHKGKWNKNAIGCYEIRGKTLGVVGYGHVGSQLSIIAEACGMRVVFYDIGPKMPLGNAHAQKTLDELLKVADFVSLHVPDTEQTKGMIGAAQVELMKKGSFLLNAARGTVVKIDEIIPYLKSGHLAGAAFDVFPQEPAAKDEPFESPLIGMPNVILTPHIGGSTEEAQQAIGLEVAYKFIQFINEGNTDSAVNFPEVSLPDDPLRHRILNIHMNVPGVLKDINSLLSQYNISAQMLSTKGKIGYLMADVDESVSEEIKKAMQEQQHNLKTRILF